MGGTSVALSGGGHRASVFGLGALMALVDVGAHPDVTSIASVSSGSLTNSWLATSVALPTADGAIFRTQAANLHVILGIPRPPPPTFVALAEEDR